MPKTINNMAGGTLGGSIVRKKLSYLASFERTMQRMGVSGNFSVPPADMRMGDMSSRPALTISYDPLTGDPNGRGRQPLAGS